MKQIDLTNVPEATGFDKLEKGGYICGILSVEDKPSKEYLEIKFDIVGGKFKGYFTNLNERFGYWSNTGILRKSYKDSALPFFKAYVTALEKSNPSYKYSNNEKDMVKRYIGIVLGEEEYRNQYGEVKIRLYPAFVHSTDAIKNNEYKVPELKKIKCYDDIVSCDEDIFMPVDNFDIPF